MPLGGLQSTTKQTYKFIVPENVLNINSFHHNSAIYETNYSSFSDLVTNFNGIYCFMGAYQNGVENEMRLGSLTV